MQHQLFLIEKPFLISIVSTNVHEKIEIDSCRGKKEVMEIKIDGRMKRERPWITWAGVIKRIGREGGKTIFKTKIMCRYRKQMGKINGERRTRYIINAAGDEEEGKVVLYNLQNKNGVKVLKRGN